MSYRKLRENEILALVEVIKKAEYIHPSQVVKREVFKKYGIYGTDRDPIVTAVYYGVMRKLGLLDKIIVKALNLPNVYILDPWLRAALRLATYLIHMSKIPITNQEREILKRKVARMLSDRTHPYVGVYYWNALENRISKFKYEPANELEYLEFKYNLPTWLIDKIINLLGREEAERLFETFNKPTLISVRVNTLKATVEEVINELRKEGKEPIVSKIVHTVLKFEGPYYFARSKLIKRGKIVPQEEACALASLILDPKPGEIIIDMCAAPGGKTTHIAELMKNQGKIYALDIFDDRLQRLKDLIKWTGVKIVEVKKLDARKAPKVLGEEIADRVLLDPPCSSSGTIAKNPEVRWRLRPEKIKVFAEYQYELLKAAIRLVKPGGVILYTVCSIFPEECEELIEKVLKRYHPYLELIPLNGPLSPGFLKGTMRAWPHKHETVGFFYALLKKKRSLG